MQYYTATYFSNSKIIVVEWNIFNKLLLPSSGYYCPRIETLCVIILKTTVQIIFRVQTQN